MHLRRMRDDDKGLMTLVGHPASVHNMRDDFKLLLHAK